MKSPESDENHPLDPNFVNDRAGFERFMEALVMDRSQAEMLERNDPEAYRYGGAQGWQNGAISQYLDCAFAGVNAQDGWASEQGLSWRDLAVFLYTGKIYE